MQQVKNIILDLGGVLLNVDYNKTTQAFEKLGVDDFDELFSQFKANELFEKLETGNISEPDFYKNLQRSVTKPATLEQLETAWNAMLLDFRTESLKFLDTLKVKYNLYLLSNTNAIHLREFNQILQKTTGHNTIDHYFIKSYYSHLMQRRKPYPDTYRFVLEDAKISAAETLFIDDSLNNIEGAKEVGIQTYHLLPGEKIENLGL